MWTREREVGQNERARSESERYREKECKREGERGTENSESRDAVMPPVEFSFHG